MTTRTPASTDHTARPDRLEGGQLATNIMHFARVLRAAGLPVGPGRLLTALAAVRAIGMTNRDDFYWALHAVFVNRREHRDLFDQAFHVFWRNPRLLEKLMQVILPTIDVPPDEEREQISRRVGEALTGFSEVDAPPPPAQERVELDAVMTWSDQEQLQTRDFEKMSQAEIEQAKQALRAIRLPVQEVRTRRFRPDRSGTHLDLRATVRKSLRRGGDMIDLQRRRRRTRRPPLVVLCDISGSMSRYSRMLLHFMHALTNDRDRVHIFLFGTRLTNITRHLRRKDVDIALEQVGQAAEDWSGGTAIGQCLRDFNRLWGRRVLGQGATVLLITDGLDRDSSPLLETEIARLHKSARRLIWLNPLLRYDGFQPKSTGIRAILPHVDDFRSVHNLESLKDLAAALSAPADIDNRSVTKWLPMLKD